MASIPELTEFITRHQVFLERLKTQQYNAFAPGVTSAQNVIIEVLNKFDAQGITLTNRRGINRILKQLTQKQRNVLGQRRKQLIKELRGIAAYEAEFEVRSIEKSIEKELLKGSLKAATAAEAYAAAIRQPLSATGQLLEPFIQRWEQDHIDRVNNTVRRGWSEGRTTSQIITEIRGTRANNYKDGVIAMSRRRASAMVRTSVQHVASTSRMATWANNPDVIESYRYVSTLDSRTTQQCKSLDGRIFSIGKGPTPPVHINCRSTTVPEIKDSILPKNFRGRIGTRSSVGGPVSAELNYYDWLKKQPSNFQKSALGDTRYKLFKAEGMSSDKFSRLNLDKNFQPLTLDQMRAKEPELFERVID